MASTWNRMTPKERRQLAVIHLAASGLFSLFWVIGWADIPMEPVHWFALANAALWLVTGLVGLRRARREEAALADPEVGGAAQGNLGSGMDAER